MKNAIIFGCTGYLGKKLSEFLLEKGVNVLGIGRKEECKLNHSNFRYSPINSDLDSFFKALLKFKNEYKEAIFYHCAWSGLDRLTNGELNDQLKNLNTSAKALKFASAFSCAKFINIGSQEEAIFKNFIETNKWQENLYSSSPIYYAGAKFANKELLQLLSYLEKIDFINTRFSIVLDKKLSGVSFVAKSLKAIKEGGDLMQVKNTQPCEIIFLDELIEAFYKVGKTGKHMADYYLGLGKVDTLPHYLSSFYNFVKEGGAYKQGVLNFDKSLLDSFDASLLLKDTGFAFKKDFNALMQEFVK
ncbi:NAD(P)-dependent oxidoreductase [uncultured Campylobacter sp.]|uniref:NAD-dependent epimerase/dehydratase family protein n=1 Tax=uncultured Campylobacter sp. TaxID=218934 RepID=UPI00260D7F50|nr:NAD(P)-dependent oxidoreductase [uncultured Campylobacter sp.]